MVSNQHADHSANEAVRDAENYILLFQRMIGTSKHTVFEKGQGGNYIKILQDY